MNIWTQKDASGQRWISIGAEQPGELMPWSNTWLAPDEIKQLNAQGAGVSDWNSDDAWGRS